MCKHFTHNTLALSTYIYIVYDGYQLYLLQTIHPDPSGPVLWEWRQIDRRDMG
jgi:hypothetical protein